MGKTRPERQQVETALIGNPSRKAHDIAEEAGLIDTMGYDNAVSYVRRVKKALRKSGDISAPVYPSDEERLKDITKLFELRAGKASRLMLLLNCYYRLRSQDDEVHIRAIDDTYEKNEALDEPYHASEAIRLCEIALTQYMDSIDPEKNEAAKKKGYPGAGLIYTDERFIEKLSITEEELAHLTSIERERHHGIPQEPEQRE